MNTRNELNIISAISDVARYVSKDSACEIASKVYDGKGRGNWGHKGRPGKRGGSSKEDNYSIQAKPTKSSPGSSPKPFNIVRSLSTAKAPPYKKLSAAKGDAKTAEDLKVIRSCKTPRQLANALKAAGIATNEMQLAQFEDMKVAKSFVSSALCVMSDFPQLKKMVRVFRADPYQKQNAYACMSVDGRTLSWCAGLYTRKFQQIQRKARIQTDPQKEYMASYHGFSDEQAGKVIQCNFHVLGTQQYDHATSTAVHEMGHAISSYIWSKNVNPFDIAKQAVKKAGKVYNARTIVQQVGLYACERAQETFAQLFCQAYLSPKPRPAAAQFKKLLKKTLSDIGVQHTLF